jgi:hypothetical protein
MAFRLVVILLCAALSIFAKFAAAQSQPLENRVPEQAVANGAPDSCDQQSPTCQIKAYPEIEQGNKKRKKGPRGSIVAAPIPISSPAIGSGVVLVGGYIFPFQRSDTVSPPSVIGAAGLFTNNGSRALVLGSEFYLKQNTYHITAIYLRGNINYEFYGVGTSSGNAGFKLPLKQTGQAFLGEFLYRFYGKFFVGPRLLTGDSTVVLQPVREATDVQPPPDIGVNTGLTGLGVRLNRDTRPNRFYPTAGTMFDFTSTFFSTGLGSKYSFESYRFLFNYYKGLSEKQVLAYNAFGCATSGTPPFYGECIYGTNNQLRGYVAGQYIDRDMVGNQIEYRLTLPWILGLAAFAGIGEVAPSVSDFRYRNILPAAGGGVRLRLSKKYNVNLRVDIAQGKEGHTYSMGIGEAF